MEIRCTSWNVLYDLHCSTIAMIEDKSTILNGDLSFSATTGKCIHAFRIVSYVQGTTCLPAWIVVEKSVSYEHIWRIASTSIDSPQSQSTPFLGLSINNPTIIILLFVRYRKRNRAKLPPFSPVFPWAVTLTILTKIFGHLMYVFIPPANLLLSPCRNHDDCSVKTVWTTWWVFQSKLNSALALLGV